MRCHAARDFPRAVFTIGMIADAVRHGEKPVQVSALPLNAFGRQRDE
jgi:hypothetical protein